MSLQRYADLSNGRLVWEINGSIVVTLDRSGWHRGNYTDGNGSCRLIYQEFETNHSYWIFKLQENNLSTTILGYIAKRKT